MEVRIPTDNAYLTRTWLAMNGGFPQRIMYMVAPSAQTSASCPEYPSPGHSSGLMNVGVPALSLRQFLLVCVMTVVFFNVCVTVSCARTRKINI